MDASAERHQLLDGHRYWSIAKAKWRSGGTLKDALLFACTCMHSFLCWSTADYIQISLAIRCVSATGQGVELLWTLPSAHGSYLPFSFLPLQEATSPFPPKKRKKERGMHVGLKIWCAEERWSYSPPPPCSTKRKVLWRLFSTWAFLFLLSYLPAFRGMRGCVGGQGQRSRAAVLPFGFRLVLRRVPPSADTR